MRNYICIILFILMRTSFGFSLEVLHNDISSSWIEQKGQSIVERIANSSIWETACDFVLDLGKEVASCSSYQALSAGTPSFDQIEYFDDNQRGTFLLLNSLMLFSALQLPPSFEPSKKSTSETPAFADTRAIPVLNLILGSLIMKYQPVLSILLFGMGSHGQVINQDILMKTGELPILNHGNMDGSGVKYTYKDAESNTWIVKSNPPNLIIHEFVASKIYRMIIGDLVPESYLFLGDQSISFCFQATPDFFPYGTKGFARDGSKFSDILAKANGFKKAVSGLEEAIYASLFVLDVDIDYGNNFAKVESKDIIQITRFDYDDSFQFYESFEITEVYLSSEFTNGHTSAQLKSLRQEFRKNSKYKKPTLDWISKKFPEIHSQVSMEQMKKVHAFVMEHQDEMFIAIENAYLEVEKRFSDEIIRAFYDFAMLEKIMKQYNFEMSTGSAAKRLCSFTTQVLKRRLADLGSLLAEKSDFPPSQ